MDSSIDVEIGFVPRDSVQHRETKLTSSCGDSGQAEGLALKVDIKHLCVRIYMQ